MIKIKNLSNEEIKKMIILANTGAEKSEMFNDFIEKIYGKSFLISFFREFENLLKGIISDKVDLEMEKEITDEGVNLKFIIEKMNGKDIEKETLLKTEALILETALELIGSMELGLVFEGFSKKLFEEYKAGIEEFMELVKRNNKIPCVEDLMIYSLVKLFMEDAIEIEIEMLGA